MKLELAHGDELLDVEVHELGQGRARVTVRRRAAAGGASVPEAREMELELVARGAHGVTLLRGEEVIAARLERRGAAVRVRRAGVLVELEVLDPLRPRVGKGSAGASGPVAVSAPIPGRVLKLPVAVGDDVSEGQPVVVVEAMKMANELRSPIAGRVTAIHVAEGATVEAGAPLVTVSPGTR